MSNRSKKISSSFLIGLFVMAGTIILIGFMIWMGATQFLKEQVYYVTYFDNSIEGLEPGSAVKYLGVPCGRVQKLQVAEDGRLVEVVINIDDNVQITGAYRIKAEMAGLAGGKFLQLFVPLDSTVMIDHPDLTFTPPYKLIQSAPSGMDEITVAMRNVIDNLNKFKVGDVSDETLNFLRASNKFLNNPELYKIVGNLASTSEKFSSLAQKADNSPFIANLTESSERLNNTTQQLQLFSDNLNKSLFEMQLPQVVNKMYMKYDTTMINTNKSISTITYRMESLLFGLTETFDEIKKTNRDLQKSLRVISDNPSQIFLSEPPPKEK